MFSCEFCEISKNHFSVCFCLQRTELVQENPEKVHVTVRELRKLTGRLSPTVMVERKIDSGKGRSLISPPSSIVISSDLSSQCWRSSFQGQTTDGIMKWWKWRVPKTRSLQQLAKKFSRIFWNQRPTQGIQPNQGAQQMETKLKHLQEILYDKGSTIVRQRVITITPVHVLKNESFQAGQGCFSDILGSQDCACFSLFCTYQKNSLEGKSESMPNAHNTPVLPGQPYLRGPLKIYLKNNQFI